MISMETCNFVLLAVGYKVTFLDLDLELNWSSLETPSKVTYRK